MTSGFQNSPQAMRSRREVLTLLSSLGIGSVVFQKVMADEIAQQGAITPDAVAKAEWIADLVLSDDERAAMVTALSGVQQKLKKIRSISITTEHVPAFRFDPETGIPPEQLTGVGKPKWLTTTPSVLSASAETIADPGSADLSAASIGQLGHWIRAGKLTSRKLTEHCLSRLKQYDPQLFCVVT